jgi:hypothetical protein
VRRINLSASSNEAEVQGIRVLPQIAVQRSGVIVNQATPEFALRQLLAARAYAVHRDILGQLRNLSHGRAIWVGAQHQVE